MKKLVNLSSFSPRISRLFFHKLLNTFMAFMLIFSIAFVTIETIDPEPVLASGEFSCSNSDGAGYVFQSTYNKSTDVLSILRGSNNSNSSFSTSTIETFSSWSHGSIEEVNSLSITKDGDMYAILKRTNTNQVYFYKLNYNASGSGTATHISSVTNNLGTGDNNAATYYEYESGGTTYKYIFTSKGFFGGNNKAIRLNADGSYTVISVSISSGSTWSTNKAKDYAWIENSTTHDFIAFNSNTDDLLGATVSHTNVGASNEAITVALSQRASNVGTSMSSNSGAAMTLGDGVVYFLENDDGRLWKYDYANDTSTGNNTNEFVLTSDSFNNSSNTDGAGCGTAPVEPPAGDLVVSDPYQGSCSNGQSDVRVDVTAYQTTMYYDLQRRVNTGSGWSSWVTTLNGQSLSAGSTHIFGNGYTQSHGTQVQFRYREGTSNPSSGSYIEVSDSSDPNNVQSSRDHTGITLSLTINCPTTSWTATTSLGACSSGTSVPSIAIENTGNVTNYFDVQYKLDSGSWITLQDGAGISSGSTETYSAPAQADGVTIAWQVRAGTSNPSSGSYTSATSRTTSGCTDTGVVSVATSGGSCASGSSTPNGDVDVEETEESSIPEDPTDQDEQQAEIKIYFEGPNGEQKVMIIEYE